MLSASILSMLAGCKGGNEGKDTLKDGRLQYTPQKNEVEVLTLSKTVFTRQLIANGKLSAAAKSSLGFRSSGTVAFLNAENGGYVEEGSVIAGLDDTAKALALGSARLSLEKAVFDLYDVLAGQGYKAKDTLSVPADILSMAKMRSGYDAARNSLRQAEYEMSGTVIRAPFSGKVADIKLRKYDNTGSDPFCTLIDDRTFDVDFTVLESEFGFLEKGLKVRVEPFASEGKQYYGQITGINPVIDKNGQVAVRAKVSNDGGLIDGMNVKVVVERDIPGKLVVPKSAVVIRDNLEVLFRYVEGRAVWTYVHTLMSNGDSYVVEANKERSADLSEGDVVIVSGNLNLADRSEVTLKD